MSDPTISDSHIRQSENVGKLKILRDPTGSYRNSRAEPDIDYLEDWRLTHQGFIFAPLYNYLDEYLLFSFDVRIDLKYILDQLEHQNGTVSILL